MKDFIDGERAIWCETQEEAEAVLRLCEKNNLIQPAPEGWKFPLSELPVEIALGFEHPFLISFGYLFGVHHRVNNLKWKPMLAENFLKDGE